MKISVDEQRQAGVVKDLVRAAGGVEAAADICGKSKSHIHRYTSATAPDSMPLRDIALLEACTHGSSGHPQVTRYLCENVQGMFSCLPSVEDADGLMMKMSEMAKDFGQTAGITSEAAADGIFELPELRRMKLQLEEQRRSSAEFLACIIQSIEALEAEQ